MLRPLRTFFALLLVAFSFFFFGCSTLYRPVYSPGKSNYKKPPEKKEAAVDLLPPAPSDQAPGGLPVDPGAAPGAAPAPAPGMLDAAPAIPGLPQL